MPSRNPRNPGPTWGYRFLLLCNRLLPEVIYRPLRAFGTAVALVGMPAQRRHSREYLTAINGKPPGWQQIFRHFFTFEETLMLNLRVADGMPHQGHLADGANGFHALITTNQPALMGTFHVGHSDLIGFLIGPQEKRRVAMVRLQVGNSHDVERLGSQFAEWVRFIWVNDPANMLFALKDAIADGESIALKCDRVEHSAKTAGFEFLGACRQFPVTIYHLALIFRMPVVLSVGLPDGFGQTVVHSSPLFAPDDGPKDANLRRAHEHFQAFLTRLEIMLKAEPYLWFNFLPLNPTVR